MTTVKDLIDAARGAVPCDLNLSNCALVDLLRGEIRKNATVSIRRGRIAGIDDGLRAERVIDLKGRFLAPGLVDSHVHIESSLLSPPEYARIVAPRGTTAVVADPHEIANVLGYEGMRYMLASSEGLPIDVYFMVPLLRARDRLRYRRRRPLRLRHAPLPPGAAGPRPGRGDELSRSPL